MKDNTIHLIAGTIFGIVALVHAIRIGMKVPIAIGGWKLPMYLSWLAVFVVGSLSVLLFRKSEK